MVEYAGSKDDALPGEGRGVKFMEVEMKKTKRFICTVLALSIALSASVMLTGCGKDKSKASGDEYVYVPEYVPIKGADNMGISNVRYVGDKFYCSASSNGGGAVVYNGAASDDLAKSDAAVSAISATATDASADGAPAIYTIDMSGNAKKVDAYKPAAVPEGKEGNVNLVNFDVDKSGNLYVIEETYTNTFNLPANFDPNTDDKYKYVTDSSDTFTLTKYAADGTKAFQTALTDVVGEGNYVNSVKCDDSGNVYIIAGQSIYAMDSNGKQLYKYDSKGWFDTLAKLPDGRIVAAETVSPQTPDSDGNYISTTNLIAMDNTKKTAAPVCQLKNVAGSLISGNAAYGAYYTNGAYFYGINTADGTAVNILNWLNCNIDSDNISGVACLDDGRIVCVTNEYNEKTQTSTPELAFLTKTKASSVEQKKVLTLATQYLDSNLKSKVLEFNKSNPDYRIDVTDYSQYNTDTDYEAGLKKMNTEILTGNIPDIIFTSGVNVEQLVTKGVLADLDQFMDKDTTVNKSALMDNVVKATEIDGKLYTAVPSFTLFTVMGSPAIVGDKPGWTVDDLQAAFKKMPEGSTVFDDTVARSDILNTCLAMDMDDYVNWSTGNCTFDQGGFQKLLEFANTFPSKIDWDNYDWENYVQPAARVAAGKQMLIQAYIGDINSYMMYKTEFGGKMTCIGFPTANGVGNMISVDSGYAISAKCADKDGAWQFVRTFLTKDYQESGGANGLPTNKEAFNDAVKTAMTQQYQTDEKGNVMKDANGNKIKLPYGSVYFSDTKSVDYYAPTQADIDELMTIINGTTKVLKYDTNITDIINDESKAYFDGEKSAEETAKLVQSRVSIYVNEQG